MLENTVGLILKEMAAILDCAQLSALKSSLRHHLSWNEHERLSNDELLSRFLKSKAVEGCSGNTIVYYRATIEHLLEILELPVCQITTDNLREYLIDYKEKRKSSGTTIDNIRRIFSSFFSWLEDEDYIVKSPARRIHKVKTPTLVKEIIADDDMEVMRDACGSLRDLALIDLLASTGMRVGELVNLNRNDINFNERECLVLGKGDKQRIVYFDARTKVHLGQYLQERTDGDPALFVSLNAPYKRVSIGGIESRLRGMGKQLGLQRIHPHKFRRTMATNAIAKGIPIEQVQKLLGHEKIETTMHYAMVDQSNVKQSHRRCLG